MSRCVAADTDFESCTAHTELFLSMHSSARSSCKVRRTLIHKACKVGYMNHKDIRCNIPLHSVETSSYTLTPLALELDI